jgi:hypothetical protein
MNQKERGETPESETKMGQVIKRLADSEGERKTDLK